MECYTPMLKRASRTAEAAEVSISIEAVLPTLRAFDAEKSSISCTKSYLFPVSYSLTSELWSSGPAEAADVGGGPLLHISMFYSWKLEVFFFFLDRGWQHRKKTRTISLEKRTGLHTFHQYVASTLRSSNQFNLTPYAKHVGERRKQSFAHKICFKNLPSWTALSSYATKFGRKGKICYV